MHSLKDKAVKGVSWSFIDSISNFGVSFLIGVILARILTPVEFGLLGMITVFITISNSIIDSGFSNALIRKNNVTDVDYNTVFYFNIGISFILYILLYFLSPLISDFFNQESLTLIMRVLSIILIINGLSIVQRTILVKRIDFKTQTKISLISSILSGVIGVLLAIQGNGIWSLVVQQILRQLLNSIFLWIYVKWKPAFSFSRKSFIELFGFGSKILISGLIDTVYKNIYTVIIGKYYSAYELGQYTRAEQFSNIFSINLITVIQRVSYPVLSKIKEEPIYLLNVYKKLFKITMMIAFTIMFGLIAISKSFVLVLIGDNWIQSISYLQIICLAAMFYPAHMINQNILQVMGRSDIFLRLEIIKKIISIGPIIIGVLCGLYYLLWGSVILSIISFYLNSHYAGALINYSFKSQVKDISISFILAFIIGVIVWTVSLLPLSNLFILIIQIVLGIILFVVINELFRRNEYKELKLLLLGLLKK